jgi:hypothetical protein
VVALGAGWKSGLPARDLASAAETSTGTPWANSTTWPLEKWMTTPSDPPEYVTVVLDVLGGLN